MRQGDIISKIDFHERGKQGLNKPKFQLRLSWDDSWHMDRPHFHEDIEILLCLSEGGDFFIDKELFPLHWGALFLINEATLHKSTASESYKRYVLHIPLGLLQDLSLPKSDFIACLRDAGHCVLLDKARANELIELFENLERPQGDSFGSDMQDMITLLSLLLKVFASFETGGRGKVKINPEFERISPILKYIEANLSQPLTLDMVAASCFMNKYHMCHLFKSVTGFSVMEYIIHCRVLKSRELLRKGMRVQEAGEAVGFRNNEHFIRTFGALTGVSPKRYAKEYLAGDKC